MIDILAHGEVPYYGDYFYDTIYIYSFFMNTLHPMSKKHQKIKYYIEHFCNLIFISQYEWNVARHDIHQFVDPKQRTTKKIFGDYLAAEEDAELLKSDDVLGIDR